MMDKSYGEYLESEHWDSVRLQALRRAGYRCQLCGNPGMLHVHHNNYDHLWGEGPGDVVVLCDRCHAWHHQAKALHEAHVGMICPHCGTELMVTVTAVELKGVETLDQELGELPW